VENLIGLLRGGRAPRAPGCSQSGFEPVIEPLCMENPSNSAMAPTVRSGCPRILDGKTGADLIEDFAEAGAFLHELAVNVRRSTPSDWQPGQRCNVRQINENNIRLTFSPHGLGRRASRASRYCVHTAPFPVWRPEAWPPYLSVRKTMPLKSQPNSTDPPKTRRWLAMLFSEQRGRSKSYAARQARAHQVTHDLVEGTEHHFVCLAIRPIGRPSVRPADDNGVLPISSMSNDRRFTWSVM
jgi:hypothetical protein